MIFVAVWNTAGY